LTSTLPQPHLPSCQAAQQQVCQPAALLHHGRHLSLVLGRRTTGQGRTL
jgi:hypothetical protein